jgi:hypothetical protein
LSRTVTRAVSVTIDVGVSVDIDVFIDVYISVDVDTTAAPIASVCPVVAPGEPHAESDQWRVRVVNIVRRGVVDCGRICRDVNDLRVGGLNLDDAVGYTDDGGYVGLQDNVVGYGDNLLGGSLKGAGVLCFVTEGLDRVHQFFGLVEERVAEVNGPGKVVAHFLDELGKLSDGLDIFVPGLVVHFGDVIGVFYKARCLDNLNGVNGRRQNNGDEGVRMQCNGHGKFLEVAGAESWCFRRRRHTSGICLIGRGLAIGGAKEGECQQGED